MITKNVLRATLLTAFAFILPVALPAASFGPGRAQMIAGGGGEVLLDSPTKQVAIRFVAEADGPLTSVRFASRVGQTWTDKAPKLFTMALVDDNAGKPGRQLAVASEIVPSFPGARAREAVFGGVPLKAGRAYHLVIGTPEGSADKQISVNYYLFDTRGGQPLNSFDMETEVKGYDVQSSTNSGAAWSSIDSGAMAAVALTVGGRIQGWAYTGAYDARLWHAPDGGKQVLMQGFRFKGATKGGSAKVDRIGFHLRAPGALANTSVPLRVRIIEGALNKTVGTTTMAVTTTDAGRFFPVEAVLPNTVLKDGNEYTLSIDIPEPAGGSAQDFLFIRTLSWGFGDPSLADATWQGTGSAMIMSPSEDPGAGVTVPKVDIPFVLDYTPVR